MMVGVRDIRLARNQAELQAAQDYLEARHKAARTTSARHSSFPNPRKIVLEIEKMKVLADDYVNRAAREIVAVQKEAVTIEAKRGASGELAPELEARLMKLHSEESRLAHEIGLPIAKELDELSNKVVEFGKHRVEEETAVGATGDVVG